MTNRISGKAFPLLIFFVSALMFFSCAGNSASKKSQDEYRTYVKRGYFHYKKGDYEKAISYFSKALEINAESSSIYETRARAYVKKREYDSAIADLSKLIELEPEDPWYYVFRAHVYFDKGDYDKVIEDSSKVINLNSQDWNYYALHELRGRAYLEKKLFKEAIADFTVAVKVDPGAQTYNYLGFARFENNEFDSAIADFNKAIEFAPRSAKSYLGRGLALTSKGDYDNAILDIKKVLDIDPTAEDVCRTCLLAVFEKADRIDEALAFLDTLLKADPQNSEIYHDRAYFWQKKADFRRAIADYEKAIELNPKDSDSYNSLAWILATCPDERYHNGMRAIKLAKKAVQLPKGTEEEWYCMGTLAAAYAEAGRFEDAVKAQEKSISLMKNDVSDPDKITKANERLEHYKANKPWREDQN